MGSFKSSAAPDARLAMYSRLGDSQLDTDHAFKAWSAKLTVGLQRLGVCTRRVAAR